MSGIIRIFKSSKGLAALMSIIGIVLINVLGVDPETAKTLTTSILILGGGYIGSTALEDAGKNFGNGKKEGDA